MIHVVTFDQGNKEKPYDIIPLNEFEYAFALHELKSFKWVYTDLYTGSEENCIKFCKDHNLKINDCIELI